MVGTGYVGLVSGTCFADLGHEVVCVDHDSRKVETLQSGEIPIFEPGLKELVASNVTANRLSFTSELGSAMRGADAVFIAVGTPSRPEDGHADLSFVHAAAKEIATHIKRFTVIVNKSTVPVGTGDIIETIMGDVCDTDLFAVVSNPEFLREGAAIDDFINPDRVVIGYENDKARDLMDAIYRPISENGVPIVFTSRRTSELTKYAANAMLATKITFINEMADLCEAVGANISEVARGIGLDERIGSRFLRAGPGYGGSCFPKDTLAPVKTADDHNTDLSIVKAVVSANDTRKVNMAKKIIKACGGTVDNARIAILGLAFKANTDDMRDAPSLTIIPYLQSKGAIITACDPEAIENAKRDLKNVTYRDDPYLCVEQADAVVILTEWDAFKTLDFKRIASAVNQARLIDLRNLYNKQDITAHGFEYTQIGSKT